MPSVKFRQLQDEAAEIASELVVLRDATSADEAEAATIVGRIDERSARATEVQRLIDAEKKLDATIDGLRTAIVGDSEPSKAIEARKAPAVHVFPSSSNSHGFRSSSEAEAAGQALRALARRDVRELRTAMSTTGAATGGELVIPELFNGFIDVLGYASVGLQVASLYPTSSNSLTIPKIGETTADFFDENAAISDVAAATDDVEINLYKLGRLIKISNELVEDAAAGVALAQTVASPARDGNCQEDRRDLATG
jgi:HK97 family phage major capsid protein